ncbi:hypothetical protein B566_EDAN000692 [Ephemera danica]|nr:hypothetical protein B566_EDAN000692 [Ephemera danica]
MSSLVYLSAIACVYLPGILAPCSLAGYGSEMSDRDRSHIEEEHSGLAKIREGNAAAVQAAAQATQQAAKLAQQITVSQQSPSPSTPRKSVTLKVEPEDAESATKFLTIPKKIAVSSSSETLTGDTAVSAPTSPGNLSTVTLVASSSEMSVSAQVGDAPPTGAVHASSSSALPAPERAAPCAPREPPPRPKPPPPPARYEPDVDEEELDRAASSRSASISTAAAVASSVIQSYYAGRRSMVDSECGGGSVSQRASFQYESPQTSSKAGVVITSFRQSQRRSSTSSAAAAFAIATSASSNPRDHTHPPPPQQTLRQSGRCSVGDAMSLRGSCRDRNRRKESVMSTAATMRVLNVLRHWVSKHAQDFEMDHRLKNMTIEFLDDIIYSPNLLPAEHKAASQLLRLITREEPEHVKIDLNLLLAPPMTPSKESIETLSALEIAEQMTFIDHQIFVSINSEEFLGQAWMKPDKANKAPNILLMTKRFNEVSQLVVSEIVRRQNLVSRIAAIEKWAAVADISRCLHNFNGVLQICAAFTNSSVFRLKKTWEKVSKTTKQSIERLQMIVSSDGRFRNLRDALHRCDPPSDSVTNYLLDPSLLLPDEELYRMSLDIEPRTSRLSSAALAHLPPGHQGPQDRSS